MLPLYSRRCLQAVRIVLASLQMHASRHKRYIVPMVSLQIDFYVRIFVRVYSGAGPANDAASKLSHVYQCTGCESFWLTPILKKSETAGGGAKYTPGTLSAPAACTECDRVLRVRAWQCLRACWLAHSLPQIGGPIWAGPLHDSEWLRNALQHLDAHASLYGQSKKIRGMLTAAAEELSDVPLYYTLSGLCNVIHVTSPTMKAVRCEGAHSLRRTVRASAHVLCLSSALLHSGHRVSSAHCHPEAIKTDAPPSVMWDIMRCWNKRMPSKRCTPQSPGGAILAKEPKCASTLCSRCFAFHAHTFRRCSHALPRS